MIPTEYDLFKNKKKEGGNILKIVFLYCNSFPSTTKVVLLSIFLHFLSIIPGLLKKSEKT